MAGDSAQRTGTQAIERAIGLLAALEDGPATRTLTELAEANGLSPSTAHRLARALCDAGLMRQDPTTERYGLGPRLVSLGQRASRTLGLVAAQEVLEELARTSTESVNLGIRDGDEVLVLLCVSSAQRLRFDQEPGTRVPVYASAMGKALLAFDPDPDGVVASLPRLSRLTGHTITSRAALRAELDVVRARGWARNDEEREVGVRTVAAPVLGPDRNAIAAIAVQGPTARLADDRVEDLARLVVAAASAVATRMHAPA